MTASDHLSRHQFMPVSDLLNAQSNDARIDKQRRLHDDNAPAGPDTTVRAVYDQRAAHLAANPVYHKLDAPLRSGDIDPVLMFGNVVHEGHHRIIRAHQIGVSQLPVSDDWDSQRHMVDWDDAQTPPSLESVGAEYWRNRK